MTDRPTDRPTADRAEVDSRPVAPTAVGHNPTDRPASKPTDRPASKPTGRPTDHRPWRVRVARLVAGRRYRIEPTGPTPGTDRPAKNTNGTDRPDEPFGLRVGLPAAVWGLSAMTTLLAATGQIGYALWAGVTDWRRFLVPAELELVAGILLLLGYRRARRGHSPFLLWAAAAGVGGFAIYTNVVHAGPRAGLLFGAASAVTMLLWFAKLYDDYQDYRQLNDENGLGLLWLLNTRLAFRALLVGKRLRIAKVTLKVMYAEVWIAVFDDTKGAKVKRRLRRRTAWRSVMKAAGHPVADLPTFATIDRVAVVNRPTPPLPPPTDRASDAEPTDSDRPADTDRPTDRQGPRASRPRRPAAPTDRKRVLHLVHTPTAIANARLLRERYPDQLPTNRQVRNETGWSYDKATPAISAYNDRADLKEEAA